MARDRAERRRRRKPGRSNSNAAIVSFLLAGTLLVGVAIIGMLFRSTASKESDTLAPSRGKKKVNEPKTRRKIFVANFNRFFIRLDLDGAAFRGGVTAVEYESRLKAEKRYKSELDRIRRVVTPVSESYWTALQQMKKKNQTALSKREFANWLRKKDRRILDSQILGMHEICSTELKKPYIDPKLP